MSHVSGVTLVIVSYSTAAGECSAQHLCKVPISLATSGKQGGTFCQCVSNLDVQQQIHIS